MISFIEVFNVDNAEIAHDVEAVLTDPQLTKPPDSSRKFLKNEYAFMMDVLSDDKPRMRKAMMHMAVVSTSLHPPFIC
jgi:hypothetical protein